MSSVSDEKNVGQYPKVCIVGLKCYGLLSHAPTPQYLGGIENQLVLLARGLVERGFPVSFVTFDHGQPDGVEFDGIRVLKAFRSEGGLPVVRFVYPRWTGLWAALARADADIYYQMGAGCETGQVAMWCKKRGKRFVFATASDADCLPNLPSLDCRARYLYRHGLHQAGLVVSQTQRQRELLLTHHDRPSQVIPAFTSTRPASSFPPARSAASARGRILWIGRICQAKRPHLLLDLSRRLPGHRFDLIGDANADSAYARDFQEEAKKCPSVILHGRVSDEFRDRMYDEAMLLVSTSEIEGFPVTFIEAWSRGIPVLSTFDPDGLIAEHGLGWYESSVDGLAERLLMVMNEPHKWQMASDRARSYHATNHTAGVVITQWERLLLDCVDDKERLTPVSAR